MKLTREAGRYDLHFMALLFVLPMLTYDVHALATWCAIGLIACGYVALGVRR